MTNDGRFIAYIRDTGLVRYDRVNGTTEVVASGITFTSGWEIDISDDGRFIVYTGPGVNTIDVFLFDYQTSQIENISSAILPPTPGDSILNLQPRIAVENNNPIVVFSSLVYAFVVGRAAPHLNWLL